LAGLILAALPWAAPPRLRGQGPAPPAAPAPGADLDKRIEELDSSIKRALDAGQITEAVPPAREKLDLRERSLGKDHWRTGDARRDLEAYQRLATRPSEERERFRKARATTARSNEAFNRGRYAESQALDLEVIKTYRELLGEEHPMTAFHYHELGHSLLYQEKGAEAEATYRRALAIDLKALGEGHPRIAQCYTTLGRALLMQGKSIEAEAMHRGALAISVKTLGADDEETGYCFSNLAMALRAQGQYAGGEAMHRRALAIYLRALGDGHRHTATGYNNLSVILADQGKHVESEAMARKAQAINLKALGESHPATSYTFFNLACCLRNQEKEAEAEAMCRKALAIRLRALGKGNPLVAYTYDGLAVILNREGKRAEAEAMCREALAIRLKELGEANFLTGHTYDNLATNLLDQGRPAEAEAMARKGLAINLKALGEGHTFTAASFGHLARTIEIQGRTGEALRAWESAAASYEQARLHGIRGLDAALMATDSPLPSFAMALAHAGRPRDAWSWWERGLARGLADEVTERATRPLSPDERAREVELLGRCQALDERIGRLSGRPRPSADDERRLDDLRREAGEIRRQLLDFQQGLERKHGPLAGRSVSLDEARAVLPDDTALVGWVDTATRHAACVMRRSGDPAWVEIPGTGRGGAWTEDDRALAGRLHDSLAARATADRWRPLAEALAHQRIGPLAPHLQGARRVVVVTSPGLAGVPVEVLFAARGGATGPGPVVVYAPSASMFAHLSRAGPAADRPATLLALGDPDYPAPRAGPAAPPPDQGMLVVSVAPNGNADLFGIRPGDVLLEYNGTALKARDDLKEAADGGNMPITLRLWRAGEVRRVEVAAGPLGVVLDPRPAAPIVLAHREADGVLQVRGDPQARLPGTRREVAAIAGLFPTDRVTTLLDDEARESVVQDLARSGRLKRFRYLHFAAHGRDDPRSAYRTALILAPDPDRPDDPAAFDTDGEVTAEQIARTWDLDADLVVLSACESGLGRAVGSEGYLGFAQPLFAKGARSLVLSLWKVDDDATALLMARFYRNLLGKREGLTAPMPKAEALAEAKRWLRGAGPSEVGAALAALPRGSIVRREAVKAESAAHPYEAPTYWAGFVLVGAPD
jgi:tetratricopeptide (TPR) repeat protein